MANASGQSRIYREQVRGAAGGATEHFASGARLVGHAGSSFDFTSARVSLPGSLGQGFVDLTRHLFAAREVASNEEITSGTTAPTYFFGGLLLPDTTPSLDVLSTDDPIMRLQWVSANVDGIMLPPVALPGDVATAGGITVELYGETVGSATAADAAQTIDIRARIGLGDTEMGATHPNFTSTPAWQGITIASGDVVASGHLNLLLVPSAHAGRAINVYGARMSYNKKTS